RGDGVIVSDADRFAVATGQQHCMAAIAPVNRANRVNNILCCQAPTGRDDGFSGRQFAYLISDTLALGENGGPAGTMNGAIDTAPAKQGRVGCVHDSVSGFLGDITGTMELDRLAAIQKQAHCEIARHDRGQCLSVRASTPGNFLPSRNSSDAPPPVEMCVTWSATPEALIAATESPPPTIEVAPGLSGMARAILNVPFAKGWTSHTPIGPFQTMVRAREISSLKASMVCGPISSAIMLAAIGLPPFTTWVNALASMRSATT